MPRKFRMSKSIPRQSRRFSNSKARSSPFALRLSLFAFRSSPFALRCSLFAFRSVIPTEDFTFYHFVIPTEDFSPSGGICGSHSTLSIQPLTHQVCHPESL